MLTYAYPPIHIDASNPDPNDAPLNLIQLFQLNAISAGEIVGDYAPYIIQNGEPGFRTRQKWFEQDARGSFSVLSGLAAGVVV
jgi:hypothetical protein